MLLLKSVKIKHIPWLPWWNLYIVPYDFTVKVNQLYDSKFSRLMKAIKNDSII